MSSPFRIGLSDEVCSYESEIHVIGLGRVSK